MVTVLAVADYRDSESWKQARLAVCAILEFAGVWSQRFEYKMLARSIERLSIAVLDNIAQGCGRTEDRNFLTRAANNIERLKHELRQVQQEGALSDDDSALLNENLDAVKQSLKQMES